MRGSVLDGVRVASPCPVSWDGMDGDERMRFCSQCRQHVFNLSGLSRADAEELIREKNGRLCVRYYQRSDGGVMTRDCPATAASFVPRIVALMVGLLLMLVITFAACFGLQDDGRGRSRLFELQPFRALLEWLNPPGAPVVMGEICVPAPPAVNVPNVPQQEQEPE